MTDRAPFPEALDRLLAVLLIALALIVSQAAHAGLPVPAVSSEMHGAGRHHAVERLHDEAGHTKTGHAGGMPDTACAAKCPAAFVIPQTGRVHESWAFDRTAFCEPPALAGVLVPASERPPKA